MDKDLAPDLQPECIHGIWPESSCVLCNGKERRQEKDDGWETIGGDS